MKFDQKVVLITGASSGIGEALARRFAERGASLVLLARRKDRLEALAKNLQAGGTKVLVQVADVTRDGDLERAVVETDKVFGRLDVVVANAGFGVTGRCEDLDLADYRRQFETNIFGVIRTVKAGLPLLKKSRGRIALIGSVAGYPGLPGASPYTMSKAAVRSLAEALRGEVRRYGISVTHIAPGFVESEIHKIDNEGSLHPKARSSPPAWLLMPASTAARKIVCAISCRRSEAVITLHGKVLVFLYRHFSCFLKALISRTSR